MKCSVILMILLWMIGLPGVLMCPLHLQMMHFVDWFDFVRVLVFVSVRNSAVMRNSLTVTRFVRVLNSVTMALPMVETGFVK